MGKLIHQTDLERKPGMLYYVKDNRGKLAIYEAEMNRGGKSKKKKRK